MNIPLTLGDYNSRSDRNNALELVNMMPEPDAHGGVSSYFLVGTPGCLEYVDLEFGGEARGGYIYPGYCITIVRNRVYVIDLEDGVATTAGNLNTSTGAVQFAENPDEILITDGTNGYVFTKSSRAVSVITDGDFPTPKACAWKDGYGVVVEDSTGKMYVSGINDFTSWDALDFTTAEYEPDNLVSCISAADSLIAFGEKTTQFYYNSGNSSYPFDNRQGANLNIGCGATNSVAEGQGFVFWLDENGQVRMLEGYVPRVISTPGIDYRIAQFSTFSDAEGFYYVQEGHAFYVLIFPTEEACFVFDLLTQQWHRRTSYADDGRYRPAWIAQYGTDILAGDYTNGKIYKLDSGTYEDNSEPIHWFFTLQAIHADQVMLMHTLLEILIDAGVGDQDEEPKLWMRYSDDGGNTWSKEKWRSMGEIGEKYRRVRWYALGRSRNRIYKIGGTDAVKRNIVKARLEAKALGY